MTPPPLDESNEDQQDPHRMTVGDGFRLAFGGFLFALLLGALAGAVYLWLKS